MGENLYLLICPQLLPFVSHPPLRSLLLSLSLVPNQRDGLEVPWGWIWMSAAAQYGLQPYRLVLYVQIHTHACAEKVCVNIAASAWTYANNMHAQHFLTSICDSMNISHTCMHTHTNSQTHAHLDACNMSTVRTYATVSLCSLCICVLLPYVDSQQQLTSWHPKNRCHGEYSAVQHCSRTHGFVISLLYVHSFILS